MYRGPGLAALLLLSVLAVAPPGAATHEDPNPSVPDWFDSELHLTVTDDLTRLTLEGTVLVHETAAEELEPVCGDSCTAGELRTVHGYASDEQRGELVAVIEERAAGRARAALTEISGGSDVSVTATLLEDAFTGEGPDDFHPPLRVSLTGSAPIGALSAAGLEPHQVQALFAMGARTSLTLDVLVDAGTNLTLTLSLPEGLTALETTSGTTSPDGSVSWTASRWKAETGRLVDEIALGRPDVVVPAAEDMEIAVTIDLADVEVHYANLLSGSDMASLDLTVSVEGLFHAIAVPAELQTLIELPALSADALRIGIEAGLIDPAEIEAVETDARRAIETLFRDSFGQEVVVEGGFLPASLDAANTGEPLGTGIPVQLSLVGAAKIPLPPEEPGGVPAFTVATIPLPAFTLPELPVPGNARTAFTILLPEGMDVELGEGSEGFERVTTEDGRTALVAVREPGDETASPTIQGAAVAIEHPFLLRVLWPVFLAIFLVLVVLPGTLIAVAVGRRRARRRAAQAERVEPAKKHRPGDAPNYVVRPDDRQT